MHQRPSFASFPVQFHFRTTHGRRTSVDHNEQTQQQRKEIMMSSFWASWNYLRGHFPSCRYTGHIVWHCTGHFAPRRTSRCVQIRTIETGRLQDSNKNYKSLVDDQYNTLYYLMIRHIPAGASRNVHGGRMLLHYSGTPSQIAIVLFDINWEKKVRIHPRHDDPQFFWMSFRSRVFLSKNLICPKHKRTASGEALQ